MPGSDFDRAVHDFLREYAVPKPLREARVAERLMTVRSVQVQSRWGDLCSWRLGSGPAVLLVHGWQDDNSLWSPLIDELERRARALVAFDLPGHGASGGDWGVSFEGTDAIVAVTDTMGPIDAVVVAHSAGCGMAVAAILEGWAVQRAVLIAPPLVEGDRWRRYADRLGVSDDVALAAKAAYFDRVGPRPRHGTRGPLTRPSTSIFSSCIHVTMNATPFATPRNSSLQIPRAQLELVDGLTHGRSRHTIPRSSTSWPAS